MHDRLQTVRDNLARVQVNSEGVTKGRLLYTIHELSRLVSTSFDQAMARHKLTHAQWWAIMHIYENEGVSQTDLANLMQMGRASAGKLLERMEAKNWIERRPDPSDNRVRRVYLANGVTPVFLLMQEEGQVLFERLLGDLTPAKERSILNGLRQIRRNAGDHGELSAAASS